MNDTAKTAVLILAGGAAIGFVLWGGGLGLAELAPALGIMWSIGTTGSAAGLVVAPVVGSAVAYGGIAAAGVLTVHLTVNILQHAKKEPLVWGTPVLGVAAGFLTQLCEQVWEGPKLQWILFSACVALLVVVGSIFYSQPSLISKTIGALCTLIAPLSVLAAAARNKPELLRMFLSLSSFAIWLPLALLVLTSIALAYLAHLSAGKNDV